MSYKLIRFLNNLTSVNLWSCYSFCQIRLIHSTMTSILDKIEDVDIDCGGKFKYILIKVHNSPKDGMETSKYIVRGYSTCEYHSDIYDRVAPVIEKLDSSIECECVGGGRIIHLPEKSIEVFGYSQGYGRADHQISVDILKKKFTSYDKISWSNDGY